MSLSLLRADFLCLHSGSDGKKSKGKHLEAGLQSELDWVIKFNGD
jgi:hypothetical protein